MQKSHFNILKEKRNLFPFVPGQQIDKTDLHCLVITYLNCACLIPVCENIYVSVLDCAFILDYYYYYYRKRDGSIFIITFVKEEIRQQDVWLILIIYDDGCTYQRIEQN